MDPLQSLRSTSRLTATPVPAHEKAEEGALSGPPRDRTVIGGLKVRKPPAPPQPPKPPTQGPVFQSLNALAESGLRFVNNADELIEASFREKREALVRIGAPYTMVASFANVEEMELFTRLQTGREPGSSPHAATLSQLVELDKQGMSFYFARDTGPLLGKLPLEGPTAWLRTNAAGATLLLARGESLRVLGADGSEQKLDSAAQIGQLRTEESASRRDVRDLLDFLEGFGGKVEPDFPLPDSMLASDYQTQYWAQQKNLLTSGRVERPQSSDFLARGKMLSDLAAGEEINLTLPGLTRPLPVDRQQAELVRRFLTKADMPEFDFAAGYQALIDSGGKAFVRQMHGDARGQLVESKTALATYLNLATGGEVVMLDGAGDLRGVRSLHDFAMITLGLEAHPEVGSFVAGFGGLTDQGFRVFRPEQVDSRGQVENWLKTGPAQGLHQLQAGMPLLVQDPQGQYAIVRSPHELSALAAGRGVSAAAPAQPAAPVPRIDPETPKKNLVMVYYSALHNSEGPLGVYDDFAYKLQQIGSSEDRDLITLRSDEAVKSHLRLDYAQPGRFENVARYDPRTVMSDARVLESFIYDSVKRHGGDEKLRLIALGHGSAEFGVMDDFSQRGDLTRIPVDDFAGAIKSALDRIEHETGKRPVIDNLILNSCLMGNSSLLQALAETGDVKALSASPELMLDSFPAEAITGLQGDVDGKDYARQLVDVYKDAIAFPDGRKNRVNALIYGAYDCDPQKAATFKGALKDFFSACTRRPDLATYLREDIADCPGYNIHLTGGPGPGFENRDLIQVARRIMGDARIQDEGIKEACARLIEATRAQVLAQRAEKAYEGREGPSFFLPVERSRFNAATEEPPTRLLRETGFKGFMTMIQDAAPRTQAHETALKHLYAEQGENLVKMVLGLVGHNPDGQAVLEQEFVSKLEKPVEVSRLRQGLNTALRTVLGTLGGAVGLGVGVAVGAAGGVLLGIHGGLKGHSWDDVPATSPSSREPGSPPPPVEAPPPQPPTAANGPTGPAASAALGDGTLLQVLRQNESVSNHAVLAALEGVGSMANKAVSYRYGSVAGKLVGVPAGVVGGPITGSVVLGGIGAVTGWQLGQKLADRLLPATKSPAL